MLTNCGFQNDTNREMACTKYNFGRSCLMQVKSTTFSDLKTNLLEIYQTHYNHDSVLRTNFVSNHKNFHFKIYIPNNKVMYDVKTVHRFFILYRHVCTHVQCTR